MCVVCTDTPKMIEYKTNGQKRIVGPLKEENKSLKKGKQKKVE